MELRISKKVYASLLMLKVRTNHLSSCEGSQEEDLHMVKTKEKAEQNRERVNEAPLREGGPEGSTSLTNGSDCVPAPSLANLSSGESKQLFC